MTISVPGWLDGLLSTGVKNNRAVFVDGSRQSSTGPIEIGCAPFDPSWFATPAGSVQQGNNLRFVICACGGSSTQQAKLDLVNKTDGMIVVASLTTTLTVSTPTEYDSGQLTIGGGGLPNSRKTYSVILTPLGGNPGDIAVCTYAALEITYQ